ncbi:MAG: hypothetical protein N2D54_05150, partial [Chloroflexota bacterium]
FLLDGHFLVFHLSSFYSSKVGGIKFFKYYSNLQGSIQEICPFCLRQPQKEEGNLNWQYFIFIFGGLII